MLVQDGDHRREAVGGKDALDTTRCPSVRIPSFTPMTMVASTLVAGAEISTFFAPREVGRACSPS